MTNLLTEIDRCFDNAHTSDDWLKLSLGLLANSTVAWTCSNKAMAKKWVSLHDTAYARYVETKKQEEELIKRKSKKASQA